MTKVTYGAGFFEEMQETNLASARATLPHVMALVSPRSVIDVGCGRGIWLSAFSELGVTDVEGFDGPYVENEDLVFPSEHFHVADLEKPIVLGRTFELAVCLEVAEHLPDSASHAIVETLTNAAPVVLFSAAIPLQGGSHHVNEQWPAYWVERFADRGYVPVDAIRRKVWDDKRVSFFYAQNIVLFVKKSELAKYPKLEEEIRMGHDKALPLVHPHMYLYYAERWRMVVPFLGKLPPTFLHRMKKILSSFRSKKS